MLNKNINNEQADKPTDHLYPFQNIKIKEM